MPPTNELHPLTVGTVQEIEVKERYRSLSEESDGYYPLRSMRFVTSRFGGVGGSGQVLKTTDGGTTWTSHYTGIFPVEAIGPAVAAPVDSSQCWLLGHRGTEPMSCLLTRDGGHTWNEKYRLPYASRSDVFFLNSYHGWIASGNGG